MDIGDELGVSAAFVSAVETGNKAIPPGWVDRLTRILRLTEAEVEQLKAAEAKTRLTVNVGHLAPGDRELVAAFARKLNELPPDILQALKDRVKFKSSERDAPFRRNRGFQVPARSTKAIWALADEVRRAFSEEEKPFFAVMEVIEFGLPVVFPGFGLEVGDKERMGEDEGRVVPKRNSIVLREDVYRAAWSNQGRARFTAAHEFGHFLLHGEVSFMRSCSAQDPVYRDSEWQADSFAGALLVHHRHAAQFIDVSDIAVKCGVSSSAARVQKERYQKEGLWPR